MTALSWYDVCGARGVPYMNLPPIINHRRNSMNTLEKAVGATTYPGRGILIGLSGDKKRAICAYFIMGRSENSRNRIFIEDGDGIRTQAHDPSKMEDPSLIIYAPVRTTGNVTIVTNGDQTDTIYRAFADKQDASSKELSFSKSLRLFEKALLTRSFEPDAPNYTPRISGLLHFRKKEFSYAMSYLRSDDGDPSSCIRATFSYDHPEPGVARFLHTYAGDGDPLPSFTGEPEKIAITDDVDGIAQTLWGALDPDNKVALFVRTIRLKDGKAETRIINKHAGAGTL